MKAGVRGYSVPVIDVEDVRRLMGADEGSAMVFVGGEVRVVGPDELESDELQGAMRVATRADIAGTDPSESDYEEIAARLDTMVSTMGA